MATRRRGTVIFGDVVASRRASQAASAWLAALRRELHDHFEPDLLAPFEYTQGDEIQGLLVPDADPFPVIVRAALHPRRMPMRWAVSAGLIDAGRGPATRRTGEAFLTARRLIEAAARGRDRLLVVTGDTRNDRLLADIAPVLGEALYAMRDRQREIAWKEVVEGRRRSEIARELGIARATVSVSARRAGLRSIERLLDAAATLFAEGVASASGGVRSDRTDEAAPPADAAATVRG